MEVSILIVSYNTCDMTLACIGSILAETEGFSFEILVIDNASVDGSAAKVAEFFPTVKLIVSPGNLGFAKANNAVARHARGRYYLLLNPDTLVVGDALARLIEFVHARPEFGIFGGRTVFADGTLNPSSCFAKPTIWNSYCRALGLSALAKNSAFFGADVYGGWARDSVREVDIVTGCFLLIRRELWERLAGFDTSYFMYGEDWDLCLRAAKLGERCIICPDAQIVHYGGASEPVRADKMVRLFQTRTLLYFSHWSPLTAWLLYLSLWVWGLRCMTADAILGVLGSSKRWASAKSWYSVLLRYREWSARRRDSERTSVRE